MFRRGTVGGRHFDPGGGQYPARTGQQVHLVVIQRVLDAADQIGHDLVFASHDGRQIGPDLAVQNAAEVGQTPGVIEGFGRGFQGLGGDTAPIEAGAAHLIVFDQTHFGAQLRGPYGRRISTGAGPDHRYATAHISLLLHLGASGAPHQRV